MATGLENTQNQMGIILALGLNLDSDLKRLLNLSTILVTGNDIVNIV
jgi:hypothetical protein